MAERREMAHSRRDDVATTLVLSARSWLELQTFAPDCNSCVNAPPLIHIKQLCGRSDCKFQSGGRFVAVVVPSRVFVACFPLAGLDLRPFVLTFCIDDSQ